MRVDSENLASGRIEHLLSKFPAVHGVAVYPVPDPHTGDQVMAALETGEEFDPDAFLTFMDQQPDMGTKWTPSLLRLLDELPVTATRKVDKSRLRRQGWECENVLELRDGRYVPLDDVRRGELADELAEHRSDLDWNSESFGPDQTVSGSASVSG